MSVAATAGSVLRQNGGETSCGAAWALVWWLPAGAVAHIGMAAASTATEVTVAATRGGGEGTCSRGGGYCRGGGGCSDGGSKSNGREGRVGAVCVPRHAPPLQDAPRSLPSPTAACPAVNLVAVASWRGTTGCTGRLRSSKSDLGGGGGGGSAVALRGPRRRCD